ncbi:MAG TPA: DUF523 domain-containing protein [Noviherbaspirillum sp.]|jgi:uncharacterized protein YbbK (DUF523 family)|uniref:DUF523 domain-containing protein n=1 Tax=Noviherbaspirillum sp. TaxID=1926288 RepID=UPI002F954542
MQRVLISACLLGKPVRYDASDKRVDSLLVERWRAEGRIVAICPETAGGLPTPRPPAEIARAAGGAAVLRRMSSVVDATGADVTAPFVAGAQQALLEARAKGILVAVLKEGSPSCGSGFTYDGSFSGTRVGEPGVTASLLMANGIAVFSEHALDQADAMLRSLDAASA